ncbi:MAG: 50S ribosomal protein L11 methyltransferase [Sphingopyxis sp.]|nr:50S ribosomal protein L11 methyltransferase [Sphingopyxis sp.]
MSWVTHFPCNRHAAERLTDEERVDDADWVTVSQSGLSPVEAGRFFVHTPQHPPSDQAGLVNLCIDAGRAFGTGHHATTTGCLLALERLHRHGQRFSAVADIGSGTGLLAFAALNLWPNSWAMATDIDPVSVETIIQNAAVNGIPIGDQAGAVLAVVADGTRHPAIAAAAPYDLVIANILAGPLITLAPALADITAPGGTLILAGLLDRQAQAVRSAYQRCGFRVDYVAAQPDQQADNGGGSWHILTLTKRMRYGYPRTRAVTDGRGGLPPGDFGSW